ncbi:hypothetical protein BCR37DRAFT_390687 [Protomyces lactucae-debilis]|uniref:G-patch domain-containing protein n=1 Tax=Protomyces lactucae-debilis TaxID=2754530 RepID=A0A1Y2FWD4_PROLT|nr:uncharacterized protein BCR37DRAFT_390687 [Protomyces lactucae-debilis]ORY86965.1 hypothetical protein BCR37DRAFT_390687 [Protomyces lactucae-debilis]
MNAQTLLQSQGWGGPGTALQNGGVTRAILTSKKSDNGGLGAKPKESDQWWDNVFSAQLQNIQVCSNTAGKGAMLQQINGGVSAAHPVAARAAHRRMFDGKSALEKVFVMGEVLKASDQFVPLKDSTLTKASKRSKSSDVVNKQAKGEPSDCSEALQCLSDKAIARQLKQLRKEDKAKRRQERAEKRQRKAARQEVRIGKLEKRALKKKEKEESRMIS